jgi:signal transduction histidine kinase
MKFSFDQLPLLKDTVESKSYLLSEEPWKDERTLNTRELIYHEGINAILLLPLLAQDEVIGVIAIDATKDKKSFSEEEIYFCLILANQASLLLERDLRHKEREEKEVLVIFGQAAAEAAHRLRNPLAVIGGFARRLVKKLKNSPFQEDAQAIAENVDKLEEIINRLLRFSRPKKIGLVRTDVNDIIKKAVDIAFRLIGEKNINIDCQLDSLPLILGDPEEIKEVFLDILRNAIEAIKEKGRIFVKSKKEENKIKVSITNTGGCIDEEIVQQIFNPFFTTKPGGTGLGLAIANATVSAYGGEIRVENDRELNLTTFVVKLPTNLTSERR